MPSIQTAADSPRVLKTPSASSRTSKRSKSIPHLKVNDLLFITEYLANGRNGTQAYLKIHPHAKPDSARANAPGILAKACVQAEIAQRIQHEGGITKAGLEADLLTAKAWAMEHKNPLELASVAMDCAKLAGFLVDKQERKTILEPEKQDAIRQLLKDALRSTVPDSSTLPSESPSGTNGN